MYKAFVRPHLKYGDMIFDQTYNASFLQLESIQYSACLAITGTIRGTSYEKLNPELDLGTLQYRRWFRKLCLFYKLSIINHLLTSSTIFPELTEYIIREMQLMFQG